MNGVGSLQPDSSVRTEAVAKIADFGTRVPGDAPVEPAAQQRFDTRYHAACRRSIDPAIAELAKVPS
jgi:hypothetical protein